MYIENKFDQFSHVAISFIFLFLEALRKYLKDLAGVKDKWFMIGSSLKIPISELHSFEAEFMQDSDRSLQEVIAYWVHNFDGAGKSQSLCEALKNVNESRLAVRLRRKYGLIVSSGILNCNYPKYN